MDKALESDRSSVLKYYNKSEKDVESDVDIVLAFLEKQAHFPKIRDEHAFRKKIEAFLVFNKFSIEKTKKNLDLCYRLRNIYPEFFDNWDPRSHEFEMGLKYIRCPPLPKLTKDLNRINYIDLTDKFDDNFNLISYAKAYIMGLETRIPYDRNTGEIIVYDCSRVNMNIIKGLTPTLFKKAIDVYLVRSASCTECKCTKSLQKRVRKCRGFEAYIFVIMNFRPKVKGYSLRVAGLHFLFPPPGGIFLLGIAKTLIKPKLFERIHLHASYESLHKLVPKELLPKNVGGDLPDIQTITDEWYTVMRKNRDNLIELSKTRTDESKRIENSNDDEYFGSMHGSFKKLDVD